jgi:hypothetical protein
MLSVGFSTNAQARQKQLGLPLSSRIINNCFSSIQKNKNVSKSSQIGKNIINMFYYFRTVLLSLACFTSRELALR